MKCTVLVSLFLFNLVAATTNPQHDKEHNNIHLPVRCAVDGHNEEVDKLTDQQLASIKSVDGQSKECLEKLTLEQLSKMPSEFFQTAAKADQSTLPATIKLAVLKSSAKEVGVFAASLSKDKHQLFEVLNLAHEDPKANEAAMTQLFSEAQVKQLPIQIFSQLQAVHLALIPASAFQSISPEQFKSLTPETVAAIKFDQFNQLRPAVKMEMTEEQAAAFPQESLEAESATRGLKSQLQSLSEETIFKFHPCSAVVLSKNFFRPAVMEILKTRCPWHIKNDAQSIFSSQILAAMMITCLLFIITI